MLLLLILCNKMQRMRSKSAHAAWPRWETTNSTRSDDFMKAFVNSFINCNG